MAAKAGTINWQSLFDISISKLQQGPGEPEGPRHTPIYARVAATPEVQRERAFSDAAAALAALWKLR
jgi:hypothetical protein